MSNSNKSLTNQNVSDLLELDMESDNGYFLFNIDKQWSNRKRRYEKGKTNVEWYGFKLDVLFTA